MNKTDGNYYIRHIWVGGTYLTLTNIIGLGEHIQYWQPEDRIPPYCV